MKLEINKSLKELTTWRVGGSADFFVNAKKTQDIINAINYANKKKVPFIVIGNGSNILVNDKGFRGLVIKIANRGVKIDKNIITCDAGLNLAQLTLEAKKAKLCGTEFLQGIPGTIGGAITGNAGTNNGEIKDILLSVTAIDKKGEIKVINKEDLGLKYRESEIKKGKLLLLQASFRLSKDIRKDNSSSLAAKRARQPKGFTAGSIFKNPSQKQFAGKLIEDAGLKGKKIGDAQVSTQHANFILNVNNAKASDIIKLISLVEKTVKNKLSVQLKREVRILDETSWR